MKQKFINALSLALIVAMLFTSVALADALIGDALSTAPGTADNTSQTVAGGDTVTYQFGALISNTGGSADNVFPGTLNVDITRSGAWLSGGTPNSLSFSSYGTTQTGTIVISVPCNSQGTLMAMTAILSADPSSNGKSLDASKDTVTLTYNITAGANGSNCAPVNTAPTVTLTGVTNGASYNKGSVPAATCQVTDAEDGNSSFAATLSPITGDYASDGFGSQTASCSYTDQGGLSATPASATYFIVDGSAPGISYVLAPPDPDGSNDWYKSDVTLTWNVSESESPSSLAKTGCVDQNITADQAETAYSCSATSAGGSASPVSVSIKRDGTVPTISGSRSPAANAAGWNKTAVTVSFVCDDVTSGLASCTPATTVSDEGAGQSVQGTAVDNAGNSATTTVSGINIDKTAPIISCTVPDQAVWYGSDVTLNCTASDGISGLLNSADASFSLTTNVFSGTETTSASTDSKTIYDVAGNSKIAGPYTFMVDKKAPSFSCGSADGLWHADNVNIACSAADGGSGLATSANFSLVTSVAAGTEVANASTNSAPVTDNVGNSTTAGPIAGNKIDRKAPTNINFVGGGITNGGTYYYGFVPAGPTGCTADDGGSGLASCDVTGGGTTVGAHSYVATATDNVGNADTATLSYTVLAWTLKGFYQPVDMNNVVNTVKNGSTVPLKFEIYAGDTELTLTSYVKGLTYTAVSCSTAPTDEIELTATGQTSLRYDATSGQFIFNWKTPSTANACYRVTMTAQDGSTLIALFKLK